MDGNNLFKLATLALEVAIAFLMPVAIVFLKKSHEALKIKMGKDSLLWAEEEAGVIVYAVEQMYPQLKGTGKYKIAAELLNDWTGNKFSDKKLQLLIEAAVRAINYGRPPKELEQEVPEEHIVRPMGVIDK